MPVGKPRLPQEPLTPEETRALRDILRAEFGLTDGAVSLGSVGVGGGL
jgi:hypothetical protein